MNRILRCVTTLLVLSTVSDFTGCATPEREGAAVGLHASAIKNGNLVAATDAPHTLLLRGGRATCTGVAISLSHIVTAAHCLPESATVVSYDVFSGPEATECISDNEQHCAPITFDVIKHPNADMAILSARQNLVGFEREKLPLLHAGGGALSGFTGLGYGAGSYIDAAGKTLTSPVGSHLIASVFTVESAAENILTTKVFAGRAAACVGDSGGPALVRLPSGGEALVGTLLYSDSGENCTDENGIDTWLRIEAYLPFIEATIGKCPRTYDGTWVMANCREAQPLAGGAITESDVDTALEALLAMQGVKKVESEIDSGTPSETPEEASSGPIVMVATAKGQYRVTFAAAELHAAVGDMYGEMKAPRGGAIVRGWSDGVDNRIKLSASASVPEMGELSTSHPNPNTSIKCTGTLIGHRIVRTSAHCVIRPSSSGGVMPANDAATFRYRRSGTYTYVSTTSAMIYWGGNYLAAGCATSVGSDSEAGYNANLDACGWADWALLILPENWHGSSAVSWMGYETLTSTALNRKHQFAGYPTCGAVDSPTGCVASTQYRDQSDSCRVRAWISDSAKWLSGCDMSPGQSGGPAFDALSRSLLGHGQYSYCTTCGPGDTNRDAPNAFFGHDQWMFDFQNSLRATYP